MNNTTYYLADIETLIPYARNSRTHSEEQIAQVASSIKEFGFLNPVIVAKDNTILAGHARVLAARKLGISEIPCIKADDLTEAQKRAYVIADNKLSTNAGWDEQMLAVEIADLKTADFDISVLGFDDAEIESLLRGDVEDEVKEDDYNVDTELQKPCISKVGDLWAVGRHRVLCGDCTLADNYTRLMEGQMADLVVTDPPYGVAYKGQKKVREIIANDNLNDADFYNFLFSVFSNICGVIKEGTPFYIFYASGKEGILRRAIHNSGLYQAQSCVWVKQRQVFSPLGVDSSYKHEMCAYGWKKGKKHPWYGGRKNTTVWEFDNPIKSEEHPTMKPVPLISYCILNSSKNNDLVLDPFLGSGTTLISSEQTGRICYGMEIEPKYCDVIVNRYAKLVGTTDNITVERDGKVLPFEDAKVRAYNG